MNNLKYVCEADVEDGTLFCPSCKDMYLHQGNVTVFEREEDAEYTTVIAQNKDTAQVNRFKSDDTCNPSSRRHGLLIEFSCEFCHAGNLKEDWSTDKPFLLGVSQHKGNTLLQWFK